MKLLLVFAAVLAVAYGTIITSPVAYSNVGYGLSGLSSWNGLGSRIVVGSHIPSVHNVVGSQIVTVPTYRTVGWSNAGLSNYGLGLNLGYGLGGVYRNVYI